MVSVCGRPALAVAGSHRRSLVSGFATDLSTVGSSASRVLLVAVLLLSVGCVDRTAALSRANLTRVRSDGRVTVVDDQGNRAQVRARRVTVQGRGDLVDDLVRDGFVFTPEDTLRLPADAARGQAFAQRWLADPDWTVAEVAFVIPEPEVIPWVAAGTAVGGLLVGFAAYGLIQCDPSPTTSCEDFETVRVFLAMLAGAAGATTGGGLAFLGYLQSHDPGYRLVW